MTEIATWEELGNGEENQSAEIARKKQTHTQFTPFSHHSFLGQNLAQYEGKEQGFKMNKSF